MALHAGSLEIGGLIVCKLYETTPKVDDKLNRE